MNYARVFFEVPLNQGFDYRIPEGLRERVSKGTRVLAPFGLGKKMGYVLELLKKPQVSEVKDILDIPDEGPIFSQELLQLAQWISEYYFCPLGLVLKTMLPAPIRKLRPTSSKRIYELHAGLEPSQGETPYLLNEEQQKAWDLIFQKIQEENFSVTLIHGVTGSGKTELYLLAIAQVLSRGKGAIVLVPEISLTPQTVDRVRNRFGGGVALLHSRIPEKERLLEWERIRTRAARVVVGPRSAVFAPIWDLGLVIVDEEHERSYKQEESPKYHARDVAIMRAKLEGAAVILGSATPSMESYFNAQHGRYDLITLTKRVEDRPLPKVQVVDMRRESESYGRLFSFSRSLMDAVSQRLERKEQVMLFLNRRGYAPLVLCPSCGHVLACPQCDQAFVYHSPPHLFRLAPSENSRANPRGIGLEQSQGSFRNRCGGQLLCHLCDTQGPIPKACPKCGKSKLHRLGVGTQRVEAHLAKLFPQAKIQRMDTDSTRFKNAHRQIFESFQKGQIQILVGTQMIAKGLDFPDVTLVGVMSADVAMSLPDFRAGEHTFQLLTQVAGRAGRGSKLGQVLVQTLTPFHPIIQAAVRQNYLEFYKSELAYREELGYPPFSRLMAILIEGKPEAKVIQAAKQISTRLRGAISSSTRIVGPHAAPISKLKGRFRWQILLFYPRGKSVHETLKSVMSRFQQGKGIKISIDMDPVSLI